MSNTKFIQKLIDRQQAKINKYQARAATAEGDEFNELLTRVQWHQDEINNYKAMQENMAC